jgi:hypothetical protein
VAYAAVVFLGSENVQEISVQLVQATLQIGDLDASVSSQNQSQERNPTLSQVVHNGVAKG